MYQILTGARMSALTLAVAVFFVGDVAGQTPIQTPALIQPTPINNTPTLIPWFYKESDGRAVWDRQRYYEDQANTVYVLPWNFADPQGGPANRADFLLLNYAQFSPPEGINAPVRHLVKDSLWKKSLQLYLNYSNVPIDPNAPSGPKYNQGQMFVSQGEFDDQTDPVVPDLGFRHHFVSATRAALGVMGQQLAPHSRIDTGAVHNPSGGLTPNALYVTASIGYDLSEIDGNDQGWAIQAKTDRFFVKDPTTNYWNEESYRIPTGVLTTNNSGVGFGDFNGDGYMDLYVGRHGSNYVGMSNVILIYDSATGLFVDQTASRVVDAQGQAIAEPSCATTEVALADVDNDGDTDIVVANRMVRNGPAGAESHDYVLRNNNGTGVFTLIWLGGGIASDSRSVAVGDLDNDGVREIVLGNAGSEGFSNTLVIPPAEDHRTQIFKNTGTGGALVYQDLVANYINLTGEIIMTSPQTFQILLADLFGPPTLPSPAKWTPDGRLDIVVVNYREILDDDTNNDGVIDPGQKVWCIANMGAAHVAGQPWLQSTTAFPTFWGKCAAIADIFSPLSTNALDLMIGTGNRHSGVKTEMVQNLGSSTPANQGYPWGGVDTSYDLIPGTEHGYGFDFADWTGNEIMDALQTSRSYNYLVNDLATINGHNNPHLDMTIDMPGLKHLSNARGKMPSRGMEDGCFFDADGDGDLDAIVAAQRGGSQTSPSQNLASTETVVLENNSATMPMEHRVHTELLTNGSSVLVDDRVSINGRNGARYPGIADRVQAADLDNDGDEDAIVHLFEIRKTDSDLQTYVVQSPAFPLPNTTYSYGWRYLENIANQSGSAPLWFRDVAATKMVSVGLTFQGAWNRGLGFDILADFDNNGALDLFTTTGAAQYASNSGGVPAGFTGVFLETKEQGNDLIFFNGVRNQPIGTLVELSASKLPALPAVQDVIKDPNDHPTVPFATWGASGACMGDIDNDGDADLVVCRNGANGRTYLASMFVYNSVTGKFVEQIQNRIDFSTYSSMLHTQPAVDYSNTPVFTGAVVDRAEQCIMGDIDADGDLDLIFAVHDQVLRCLRNRGTDTNQDGIISSNEIPTQMFEDVTPTWIGWLKPSTNFTDMDVVDVDGDGDLDICVDPFNDLPTIWRNDQVIGWEPRCTEIWPRIGAVKTRWVDLHGVNLDGIDQVELRYAGGVTATIGTPNIIGISSTRAKVYLPATIPVGLAQVRVRRTFTPQGGTNPVTTWSMQYKGYFILLNSTTIQPAPIIATPAGPIQHP